MVPRVVALTIVFWWLCSPAAVAEVRLPFPGGAAAFRRAAGLPASTRDEWLLVEAARAWYGAPDPFISPPAGLRRLIDHVRTSTEPLSEGPALPLSIPTWQRLLAPPKGVSLASALITNRNAVLACHGLMAMDAETVRWMEATPSLLEDVLTGSAGALAIVGPALRVRNGVVQLPGGPGTRHAWESLVRASVSDPEEFTRHLLKRSQGRLAWVYSVLAELDSARRDFALGPGGVHLEALARHAIQASAGWFVSERPFWRPAFDYSMMFAIVDVKGGLRGSDSFWREVFHDRGMEQWKAEAGEPLDSETLLRLIFAEPHAARTRWEVFSLGQRMPGLERDARDAGLALRSARHQLTLALTLDRLGLHDPALHLELHRSAARAASRDPDGGRGELTLWQAVVALIDRATMAGGFDAAGATRTLREFAGLKLDDPRAEITAWFLSRLLPALASRRGAPAGDEDVLLAVVSGSLTPEGPRRRTSFNWEGLEYSFAGPETRAAVMAQVRAAQFSPALDDAKLAWLIAEGQRTDGVDQLADRLSDERLDPTIVESGHRLKEASGERDLRRVREEARRTAERVLAVALPGLVYAPHLAVTEVPTLGADVAYRHDLVGLTDPVTGRLRPWQIAHGSTRPGSEWRLEGSMLLLDVGLATWYLRRNAEPAASAPRFDEVDMGTMAEVAALTRSGLTPSAAQIDAAAQAVRAGREMIAAARDLQAADDLLAAAGVDPWRRRSLQTPAPETLGELAGRLSAVEAWRVAGEKGRIIARRALDGCVCFGDSAPSILLMLGRRGSGAVGAIAVDAGLTVAAFLASRGLPAELFGDLVAGVLSDVIEGTDSVRPDDFAAIAEAAARVDESRLDEHLLALVADGTLARPGGERHR